MSIIHSGRRNTATHLGDGDSLRAVLYAAKDLAILLG